MDKVNKAEKPTTTPSGSASGERVHRRRAMRFEKVFPVMISSEQFGECNAMARNVSAGGILLEMADPLPLGTRVRVHFSIAESQASIVARGEVKNHYFLNYSDGSEARSLTGLAVRFTEFETRDRAFTESLDRMRILH
jgi:hypothetical protein